MAEVNVTVVGYAGNDPVLKKSKSDLSWTQFRVGSTRRIRDNETGQWLDAQTMWFTVKAWGSKAENIIDSVRRGTPVVVTGRLAEEPYVLEKVNNNGEQVTEHRNGLTIENAIVAVDLSRGAAKYFRTDRDLPEPANAPSWARATIAQLPDVGEGEVASEGWTAGDLDELAAELVAA